MEIIELRVNEIKNVPTKTILCLGYFDAVHIGHQALIKSAVDSGKPVSLMTFDTLPSTILYDRTVNCSLTSLFDKAQIFEKLGVSILYILHFTKEVASLKKDEFIEKVLKPLDPLQIICGDDYSFGFKAEGDPAYLSKFFDVISFKSLTNKNVKISSTDISNMIREGKIKEANKLLGRNYQITGLVVEGSKNGRKIGFPTANLSLAYPYILPKIGVYIGKIEIYDKKYYGIISVSTHPTIMELKEPIIEVNVYDFEGNIYGLEVSVEFIEYMHEIERFNSLDELKQRLEEYKKYLIEKYINLD